MTENELERLERDVEQARTRLAIDIARIKGPSVLSAFKQDVISRATRASTDGVRNTAHHVLADVKNRVAANPAAALAIGAGLAWRMARHPPIASILVGLGVAGLLKTDPKSGPSPVVVRGAESANSAAELLREIGEEARERATRGRQLAGEMLDEFSSAASAGASSAGETASAMGAKASDIFSRAAPQTDGRDHYLLGAAALAIGAAALMAYQRRDA